jgi:hypothetical protein
VMMMALVFCIFQYFECRKLKVKSRKLKAKWRASLKTLPFTTSTLHPSPKEKGTRSF